MNAYTGLVATYLLPSTIHTRRWQFWWKFCRWWAPLESSGIIKEILWNCVRSNKKKILWNYAVIGLWKNNSWLKYAKVFTYKTKGVWPPQSIDTTTCAAQGTTTFFQLIKTCTWRRITPIDKRTHKTYTKSRRIFPILWTVEWPNYNQNPQHIVDATIYTKRKHRPGCKTLSWLLCHASWCQNTIFESEIIIQVHSDVLYMNYTKAHSTASGDYFLGKNIKPGKPIFLNGAIHTLCKIIGVVASAD